MVRYIQTTKVGRRKRGSEFSRSVYIKVAFKCLNNVNEYYSSLMLLALLRVVTEVLITENALFLSLNKSIEPPDKTEGSQPIGSIYLLYNY